MNTPRELRSVTCHMGSQSVTCHPTQVNDYKSGLNLPFATLPLFTSL